MAQRRAVDFPTGVAQLPVYQQAGLGLVEVDRCRGHRDRLRRHRRRTVPDRLHLQRDFGLQPPALLFLGLCQLLPYLALTGLKIGCNLRLLPQQPLCGQVIARGPQFGLQVGQVFGLAAGDIAVVHQHRHRKRLGLEPRAGLAKRPVEPDAELARDTQRMARVTTGDERVVHPLIAVAAQQMQHAEHFFADQLPPPDIGQQIGLARVALGRKPVDGGQVTGDDFAELAQLQQTGVGIGQAIALRGGAQLRQQRIGPLHEGKVGQPPFRHRHALSLRRRPMRAAPAPPTLVGGC